MQKLLVIISVIASLWPMTGLAQSSQTDHFRTIKSGLWSDKTVWQTSPNGQDPWISATLFPKQESNTITIRDGHTVEVQSIAATADQLVIESSAKLTLISGTLTISNGPDVDLSVYGIIELHQFLNATLSPQIVIKNGGYYINYLAYGTQLNTCTWENGSTIKLIPLSTYSTNTNLNQNFHHFIWDVTNLTSDAVLDLPDGWAINGDLILTTTNDILARFLVLSNANSTVNYFIGGNLCLNQYTRLILSSSSSGNVNLNLDGSAILGQYTRLNFNPDINSQTKLILKGNLELTSSSSTINNPNTSYKGGYIVFDNINFEQQVNNAGTINCVNYLLNQDSKVTFQNKPLTLTNANYNVYIKDNASLLCTNTSTPLISATVERTLSNADWSIPQDGWHLLSSPVASQVVANGGFTYLNNDPNYPNYDFYSWEESQDKWLNQKIPGNQITTFNLGKGYFVAYNDGGTKTFTGNLNVSDITKTNLSYTGTSPYAGFHLLGNPFQCSLDWNHVGWAKSNVNLVANIWDEAAMNYLPVTSANPMIAPNQGFFIQVMGGTNSLTIPAAARTHSNAAFLKNGNTVSNDNTLWIRVQSKLNATFDEAMVRLSEDADSGYDLFDGHELAGSDLAPQLFTALSDEEYLSVNSLPVNGCPSIIPLFFRQGGDTEYRLTVLENTMQKEIWLEDTQTGNFILLDKDTYLDFNAEKGKLSIAQGAEVDRSPLKPMPPIANSGIADARFVLHMGPLGIQESQKNDFKIYSFENNIYIRDLAGGVNSFDYRLLNLAGRTLREGKATGKTLSVINVSDCPPGVYLFTVTGRNHSLTQKIFLE